MNRLGVFSVIFILSLVSAFGGVIYLRGEVLLEYIIENHSQSLCQCQIQVEKLHWSVKKPLKIEMRTVGSDLGGLDFTIGRLNFELVPMLLVDQYDFRLHAKLNLENVKAGYNSLQGMNTSAGGSIRQSSRQLSRKIDGYKRLSLELSASDLQFRLNLKNNQSYLFRFAGIQSHFDGAQQKLQWDFQGDIAPPSSIFNKAVALGSKGALVKGPEKIEFTETLVKLMGVPIEIRGGLIIETNATDIQVNVNKIDLSQVNADLSQTPLSQLSGFIDIEANVLKESSLAPWQVVGKVGLQDFSSSVNLKGDQYSLQGPLKLNLAAQGKYHEELGYELPNVDWALDFTQTHVTVGAFLNKQPEMKLTSRGTLSLGRGINVKASNIELGPVHLLMDGFIDPSKLVDLKFHLQPLSLLGLEKIFPFLGDYPLVGQAELAGRYSGNWEKPEKANLVFEKLLLENVRGKLDWKVDDTRLSGPFLVNLKGSLNVTGKEVRQGELDFRADLTGMEIQKGAVFQKPSQQLLDISVAASQDKGALRVKHGEIKGPFGVLGLQGVLPVPPVYFTDLEVASNHISFAALKSWFPGYANVIPDGNLKGQLTTKGELNTSDLLNSRLFTKGDLKILIPRLLFLTKNESSLSSSVSPVADMVEPILPSTRLLQAMSLNLDVMVGHIVWKNLNFSNIHLTSRIAEGKARGQSSIGKILDGSIMFPSYEIHLFEINPSASFSLKAHQINVAKALEIFLPPLKGFAQGALSGEFVGLTKLPRSSSFLGDLQSSGRFRISQASLSSLPIKTSLESKISTLPIGSGAFKNFTFQNSNLTLNSDFAIANQQLSVKPITILTPEGHELTVEGQIGFDRTATLQGQLLIANINRGGSFFEANKDASNRLLIPVSIEGNLMQPEVKVITGTLTEMMERTLQYERKRSLATAQEEMKKKAQPTAEMLRQKAQEDVKKGIKDLFSH